MNVMVIGGGGREHAIVKKLRENRQIDELYVLPGNGGMAREAVCVPIGATDLPAIAAFAREKAIDYAVVTPDDPLVLGCVDALEEIGVPCFGPRANAALIEGSKVFAKDLMKKYGIPTARYEVFTELSAALDDEASVRVDGSRQAYGDTLDTLGQRLSNARNGLYQGIKRVLRRRHLATNARQREAIRNRPLDERASDVDRKSHGSSLPVVS